MQRHAGFARETAEKEISMKKIVSLAASALMLASSLASAPAFAAPGHPNVAQRQQYVINWCKKNPRDNDCRDFNHRHNNWSDAQYNNWFNRHRHDRGFDPMAAAVFGIAGAAIGAAMMGAQNNAMSPHQRACVAKFGRAYDVRSDLVKLPGHRPMRCRA